MTPELKIIALTGTVLIAILAIVGFVRLVYGYFYYKNLSDKLHEQNLAYKGLCKNQSLQIKNLNSIIRHMDEDKDENKNVGKLPSGEESIREASERYIDLNKSIGMPSDASKSDKKQGWIECYAWIHNYIKQNNESNENNS